MKETSTTQKLDSPHLKRLESLCSLIEFINSLPKEQQAQYEKLRIKAITALEEESQTNRR